jgi:hypothetical protein
MSDGLVILPGNEIRRVRLTVLVEPVQREHGVDARNVLRTQVRHRNYEMIPPAHNVGNDASSPFPPARDFARRAPADTRGMSSSTLDMSNAPVPRLLLMHCAVLDDARPTAYARLEEELGDSFARMLVSALASPQGIRGSSSP